jgi:hypothetical protein
LVLWRYSQRPNPAIGVNQLLPAPPELLPLNEAAEAQRAATVLENFGLVAPGVVQYTTDLLFRELWLRPALAPRTGVGSPHHESDSISVRGRLEDGSILGCRGGSRCPAFIPAHAISKESGLRGMEHPIRGSGIMVTRNLFGFVARAKGSWCGRRDLNPHGPCGPTDFHTLLRLSPPPTAFAMGFGVWTIPSPCPDLAPGVRCCPSSLYTFPAVSGRAWLGIAMLQGSPTLSSSASLVSRRALKFALKSDASAVPPRPHGFKLARMND